MNNKELQQKVREGMASFALAFNLPTSTLLDNVDYYFNPSQGETENERLSSKQLQE